MESEWSEHSHMAMRVQAMIKQWASDRSERFDSSGTDMCVKAVLKLSTYRTSGIDALIANYSLSI